jgi:hypothetical protein
MKKIPTADIAWGAGIVALALVATLARQQELISEDASIRLVLGVTGLMLVWYGNRAPKAFIPDSRARQAARFSGWSMVLSGLVYATLWGFAPFPVAMVFGCGAVMAGVVATFLYCRSLRRETKAA